jgi:hypothetical protein
MVLRKWNSGQTFPISFRFFITITMTIFEWEKKENLLDAAAFNEPLREMLIATTNRIDREWPVTLGDPHGRLPFLWFVSLAHWTFRATIYLLADKPEDPKRMLEFAIVVPPINRTIVDMVFNVIFILDDYGNRLCWYLTSGCREVTEQVERFKLHYGNDPEWTKWLHDYEEGSKGHFMIRDLLCHNAVSPPTRWFPHPGAMISKGRKISFKNEASKNFLEYLDAWYYRVLSSSSHSHWHGLAERAVQIHRMESTSEDDRKFALKYKSDCIMQQVTLILCLLSELILFTKFDGKSQLAYLWGILTQYWGLADEIYSMRYKSVLTEE